MVQKVVIIGAGPSGLLLAHYLVRKPNYDVEVYERRSASDYINSSSERSFPISLQERGRKAIRTIAGLEAAIAAEGTFCQGTIMHRAKGKPRRISRQNPLLTIDRNRLITVCLQQLQEYANSNQKKLKIQFDCKCIGLEQESKTLTLETKDRQVFHTTYDVLIGADGAKSRLRQLLAQNTDLSYKQSFTIDAYKSIYSNRLNSSLNLELESDCLHTWNLGNNSRMILVPQPGDRLNGVFIFEATNNPMAGLSTQEDILAFFQQHLPRLTGLISPEEAEQLLHRPIARITTVRCSRFHERDSIGLIGDAAHAVSPSIGQGCNSALEDVLILSQLLDKYQDNWSQVLPQFSRQRVPDAHALRELSDYAFPRTKRLVFEFVVNLTIRRFLHRLFPQLVQPFLFDLFLDSDMSYSKILNLSQDG
jgi:kynurenine 3-monooxygenase